MRSDLRRDIGMRLIALVLAVALWFVAAEDLRPEPIVMEERVVVATVNLVGVAKDLIPQQSTEQVEVRLRAPANAPMPERLEAYVEMGDKKAGEHSLPVRVSVPSRFSVVAVKPERIMVHLEREVSESVALEIAVMNIPPNVSVTVGAPEPPEVTLVGAKSTVAQVARVYAVATFSADTNPVSAPIRAVDAGGNPLAGIELDPQTASVPFAIEPIVAESEQTGQAQLPLEEPLSAHRPDSSVSEISGG